MEKLKKLFLVSSIFLNLVLAVFVVRYLFPHSQESKNDNLESFPQQEGVLFENSAQTQSELSLEERALGSTNEVVVSRIVDGDTIAVEGGEVVRYIGIDTPETNDCFGKESSAKNSELVLGKRVTLEKDVSERDRYQRLLRYVWIDGKLINEILAREGYAKASSYPPDVKYQEKFREAEKEARDAGRGLWAGCGDTLPIRSSEVNPTLAPSGNWICSSNTYNCSDFKTQAEAQSAFEACGGIANDVHKLDRDKDGRVCETLP